MKRKERTPYSDLYDEDFFSHPDLMRGSTSHSELDDDDGKGKSLEAASANQQQQNEMPINLKSSTIEDFPHLTAWLGLGKKLKIDEAEQKSSIELEQKDPIQQPQQQQQQLRQQDEAYHHHIKQDVQQQQQQQQAASIGNIPLTKNTEQPLAGDVVNISSSAVSSNPLEQMHGKTAQEISAIRPLVNATQIPPQQLPVPSTDNENHVDKSGMAGNPGTVSVQMLDHAPPHPYSYNPYPLPYARPYPYNYMPHLQGMTQMQPPPYLLDGQAHVDSFSSSNHHINNNNTTIHPMYHRAPGNGYVQATAPTSTSSPPAMSISAPAPRRHLGEGALIPLRNWMLEHLKNPYPNTAEKEELAERTGLSIQQVVDWTTNFRKRTIKPLLNGQIQPSCEIHYQIISLAKRQELFTHK